MTWKENFPSRTEHPKALQRKLICSFETHPGAPVGLSQFKPLTPTLDVGSGHDLRVLKSGPTLGSALGKESPCPWEESASPSPSVSAPTFVHELPVLSSINRSITCLKNKLKLIQSTPFFRKSFLTLWTKLIHVLFATFLLWGSLHHCHYYIVLNVSVCPIKWLALGKERMSVCLLCVCILFYPEFVVNIHVFLMPGWYTVWLWTLSEVLRKITLYHHVPDDRVNDLPGQICLEVAPYSQWYIQQS